MDWKDISMGFRVDIHSNSQMIGHGTKQGAEMPASGAHQYISDEYWPGWAERGLDFISNTSLLFFPSHGDP